MSSKKLKFRLGHVLVLALCLVAIGLVWRFQQDIRDQFSIWTYEPSVQIETMTSTVSMTEKSKRLFYASKPELLGNGTFATYCPVSESGSAILGCYTNGFIYIYDVENADLDGITDVTAAHETLHAAWDRLSRADQRRIGQMLAKEYEARKTNATEERMAYYKNQGTDVWWSELHSILPTEYKELSSDIETYYSQFFYDRQEVFALYNSYHKVFTSLEEKVDRLKKEIEQLNQQIKTATATYESKVSSLNNAMNAHRAAINQVDRTSAAAVAAYNQQSDALNAQASALNQERQRLTDLIARYNTRIREYNAVGVAQNELYESIDSGLETADSI